MTIAVEGEEGKEDQVAQEVGEEVKGQTEAKGTKVIGQMSIQLVEGDRVQAQYTNNSSL